ncbi:bone sialoprotein 2 precursor [Xenopus tropicalis]|uniref:Bone sialoprotein 2 precursor n=1 Tax=Xenopus tropicalis TaxID=8364 RepID=B9UIT8_XENTR|nr:bone sialoprotein 2 precursor [Xenopus tropicalis]ACF33435.1 integrin-binding sialoprotein [Xenopus tropicalis]|eukprot:NP_001139216.1 bone sialoprotein 2 precursor [Xenopus tropicalis]
MKTALIFLFLLGLTSSFYINRFQRRWKDDEGKISRNKYGYNFYRSLYMEPRFRQHFNYAKGGSSSEEDSSDEGDSDEKGINGKADSQGNGANTSEGKGAAEGADSEEEEEEASEVEENSASQNETESNEVDKTTNSTSLATTQEITTAPFTRDHEINGGGVTGPPRVSYDENGGNEEGSNGGISSTATYETESISVQYEHGYEHTYDHENEVDYRRIRGDNYARYEDEYNYRNRYYDEYARQYDYYQ